MTHDKLLSLAKALSPATETEVRISFSDLLDLYPEITIKQLANIIVNLPGVQINEGEPGGMTIPDEYFEKN